MSATTYTASVTAPDGTIENFNRYGNGQRFVIFGRDAVGIRKDQRPFVAQWCASEEGAHNVLPDWQSDGGEWMILPVTYTEQAHR